MGTVSATPVQAWLLDPFAPDRRRLWDGSSWSARVVGSDGEEAISWRPDLTDLAPPLSTLPAPAGTGEAVETPSPAPLEPAAYEPALLEPAVHDTVIPLPLPLAIDPVAVAFGTDDDPLWMPAPSYPTVSHRRRLVPALVVVGVLALAAGAGAGVLQPQRPTEEHTTVYRDGTAGFALRYPDAWSKQQVQPGVSIRFVVGGRTASITSTNSVKVTVDSPPSPLPPLDEVVRQNTETLRASFPSIRLDEAARTTLARGVAYRMRFTVVDNTPPIHFLEVAGRTTDGRPLTVVITIREPRTAPTDREIEQFLASITPA